MEYPSLARAKAQEPNLSVSAFSQRCKSLAVQFGSAIGVSTGELVFAPEISSTSAFMTLGGRVSEVIERNRGRCHHVIPIAQVTEDIHIWAGYRECWQKLSTEHNFRFVEGGFTLHLGRPGELTKPQILRSEWVGRRSRAFIEHAGHPHWQLDVLESFRANVAAAPARFDDPVPRVAVEFNAEPPPLEGADLLMGLTMENMHLASAAHWWRLHGATVAHQPDSVDELDRWVLGCVTYLRQEAGRCKIVAIQG